MVMLGVGVVLILVFAEFIFYRNSQRAHQEMVLELRDLYVKDYQSLKPQERITARIQEIVAVLSAPEVAVAKSLADDIVQAGSID